jgi:RNA polymerase sigma-70 factor, ECF subfamily
VKDAADLDANLLARAARGEARAASELVARRLPRIVGLARRLLSDPAEAEDVAQDAFLRLWKQAPKWREEGAKVETWLWTVTTNLCLDRLRRRRSQADPAILEEMDDGAGDPLSHLESSERAGQITAAILALPDRQRAAIVLKYQEGRSQAEAAGFLDLSEDAFESLLARARRTLRANLSGV